MIDIVKNHIPVMLDEVLAYLQPNGGIYVDCTFGEGGYTKAILAVNSNNKVIAFDQDPDVVKHVDAIQKEFPDRLTFLNNNFSKIHELIKAPVDGIVFDLGVSTKQILSAERGFSFTSDGPIDMRMSKDGISAYDVVNSFSEEDLADIIYRYGDEHQSRKIAKYIVVARGSKPITTTFELAAIINKAKFTKFYSKINPATKSFQAIRIFVNNELDHLEKVIIDLDKMLNISGRLIFVSFHSLEDSIVKKYLQQNSKPKVAYSKYHEEPVDDNADYVYKLLTNKALTPSKKELENNISSRSAKFRAAMKIRCR